MHIGLSRMFQSPAGTGKTLKSVQFSNKKSYKKIFAAFLSPVFSERHAPHTSVGIGRGSAGEDLIQTVISPRRLRSSSVSSVLLSPFSPRRTKSLASALSVVLS